MKEKCVIAALLETKPGTKVTRLYSFGKIDGLSFLTKDIFKWKKRKLSEIDPELFEYFTNLHLCLESAKCYDGLIISPSEKSLRKCVKKIRKEIPKNFSLTVRSGCITSPKNGGMKVEFSIIVNFYITALPVASGRGFSFMQPLCFGTISVERFVEERVGDLALALFTKINKKIKKRILESNTYIDVSKTKAKTYTGAAFFTKEYKPRDFRGALVLTKTLTEILITGRFLTELFRTYKNNLIVLNYRNVISKLLECDYFYENPELGWRVSNALASIDSDELTSLRELLLNVFWYDNLCDFLEKFCSIVFLTL